MVINFEICAAIIKISNLLLGWTVPPTAPTMAHVMLMDHVTVMLAGPESCAIKRCVPQNALAMADVICKQPSVSVVIPTLVSVKNLVVYCHRSLYEYICVVCLKKMRVCVNTH